MSRRKAANNEEEFGKEIAQVLDKGTYLILQWKNSLMRSSDVMSSNWRNLD